MYLWDFFFHIDFTNTVSSNKTLVRNIYFIFTIERLVQKVITNFIKDIDVTIILDMRRHVYIYAYVYLCICICIYIHVGIYLYISIYPYYENKCKMTIVYLTLSLSVTHCVSHNTDPPSNSNISKMVKVKIAFTRTFFREHLISFLMIAKLIYFTLAVL